MHDGMTGEEAITKSKVRYKTVRGYESARRAVSGVALTQWVCSGAPKHDLGELVGWEGWLEGEARRLPRPGPHPPTGIRSPGGPRS